MMIAAPTVMTIAAGIRKDIEVVSVNCSIVAPKYVDVCAMRRWSVGDLPAYGGLGERGFGGDLAGGGAGHLGEGVLNVVAEGPYRNFFHGVAVSNGGLFEAVDDGDGCEAVDAGDLAVSVAEVRCVAGTGGCDGEAADVNA